ncbi:MAG: AraC family transcriptional regulator, partial [Duncaniella freteri]|nr:AraC family transcriptional regulator [Duncaniella freteri]
AEQVGFNSASYFSKCFQEKFGCRPSEFSQKQN